MRILAKSVIGCTVEGADGYVGVVKDVFFSSDNWQVRYLMLDTGKWLPGRRVVLAPHSILRTEWPIRAVYVRQTRQQVKDGPSLLEHEPVSRQKEAEFAAHFQWPTYWGSVEPIVPGPMLGAAPVVIPSLNQTTGESPPPAQPTEGEADLRSVQEVTGYHIQADDGEMGYVQDFVVDDEVWVVRYLVVDTHKWLPSSGVLVSPAWAQRVMWDEKRIDVGLSREAIKTSPAFNPWEPINRRYEEQLYDYYGRPAYWR